jgi:hypothetical protein
MKQWLFALSLLIVAALCLCPATYAQDSDQGNQNNFGPYRLLTTISSTSTPPLVGGLTGFDISWVDSKHARYYLAARGSAGPSIPVIDTDRNELIDQIFLSNAANGVVAIHRSGNGQGEPGAGTLVLGTTPNTGESSKVLFIDLDNPHATPFAVDTGGHVNCTPACRADELAYDPRDHIILVANDRDPDLFVTFISTENPPHVLGKIYYDGSTPGNPVSTGGIEQPVWDKKTRRFYLAIPSTKANPNGEVDEIDPVKMTVKTKFVTTCGPAGLVLIPGQRLMTSCGDVLDIASGMVVTTAPKVSPADEIWYNPGDERVYFGGITSAPVVSGEPPYAAIGPPVPCTAPLAMPSPIPWCGSLVPPPGVSHTSHSIAADSENNHIFLPVSNTGVLVFTAEKSDDEGNNNQGNNNQGNNNQ